MGSSVYWLGTLALAVWAGISAGNFGTGFLVWIFFIAIGGVFNAVTARPVATLFGLILGVSLFRRDDDCGGE